MTGISIAPGKDADLVVVDGDPLDSASLADRIGQMWKAGTLQSISCARSGEGAGGSVMCRRWVVS
jgi:hypothetical protein